MSALKDQILLLLEPHVDALAGELAELVPTLVREQLAAILANASAAAAPAGKVTKAKLAIASKAKPAGKTKRKPNSCSKCGESGFTAATCGKTHNTAKGATPASSRKPLGASRPASAPLGARRPAIPPPRSSSEAKSATPPLSPTPPHSLRPIHHARAREREASHRGTCHRPGGHRSSTVARSSPTYRF